MTCIAGVCHQFKMQPVACPPVDILHFQVIGAFSIFSTISYLYTISRPLLQIDPQNERTIIAAQSLCL